MSGYSSQFKETLEKLEETIHDANFPQNDNVTSLAFFIHQQQQVKSSFS